MKTYNPGIYPITFCVADITEMDNINKKYTDCYGERITLKDCYTAICVRAIEKTKNTNTVLLIFRGKPKAPLIAHEATHAALGLIDYIGACVDVGNSDEHLAYIIEYIVECVEDYYKTRKKK